MFWGASGAVVLTILLSISENAFAKHSLRKEGRNDYIKAQVPGPSWARNATKSAINATSEEMEDDGGVEVSWSPTVSLVEKSLEDTEAERSKVQEKLRLLRKSCDVQAAACDQEVEETAAELRRLTIAVAQLRQMRQNDAEKVEEEEKKRAVQEATVERDISDLVALQHFARLSKDSVDFEAKKYHELSAAYGGKVNDAEAAIVKAHAKLDNERDAERTADGAAVGYATDAMAISDGVNATDAFVDEEVMEAQRKEHSASALFKKAQSMASRAASMLRYHRARTASVEDEEEDDNDKFPIFRHRGETEGGANAAEEDCPPHHSESGESFIQRPCVPASRSQGKDAIIEEAEAAARARASVRKASADDESAPQGDDLDSAEDTD